MTKKYLFFIFLMSSLLSSCDPNSDYPPEDEIASSINHQDEVISSGELSGLYRNAGSNSPVILIVPGSGPTDLNGNSPLGINSNVYKQMSAELAEDGISTVRVDKRGMFSSAGAGDPNDVTVERYAEDYKDWVEVIREKTDQPCVYMLGHSEGAFMVSAASIDNPNICGLILVSGLGRSFGDVLREQLTANPANKPILEQAFGAIEKLEQGQNVISKELHPALQPLFAPESQNFLISIMQKNPAEMARDAGKRTLIVQGTHDLQVSISDAKKLAEATGAS